MTAPGRRFGSSPAFALASLPVLVFFGACLAWLVVISFFRPSVYAVYEPAFTLANYTRALTSPLYVQALLRSLRLSALATVITAFAAYPIAFFICRRAGRAKGALLAAVASVFLVTFIVKIYAWTILLQRLGVVDRALLALGLIQAPTGWVGTEAGVLIGLVYASLPYMILTLVTSLERVPAVVEHAAACAGARPSHVFATITLPLTVPGLVSGLLFTFALDLAAFVVPALLGAGSVNMIGLVIQRVSVGLGTAGGNWPLAAALSVVLLVVCAAFSVLTLRVLRAARLDPA